MIRIKHTSKLLIYRWPLWLMLIVFIIAKWHHLHFPFYWDESWSYAPGVRLMYDHGPSLMPNAIDTFYSRGHPLLFYASSSAWMHATGGYSHFHAHLFALVITLCLFVTVYEVLRRFADGISAIIAVAALMLHVGLFVQASSVMPEMMVALFALIAIAAFAARKFWLAGGALTLLVFTKESSATAGLVLGIAAFIALFQRRISVKEKVYGLLSAGIPALLIGAFFLLQKHLLGWYLYPEHTGMISFDWGTFFGKFHSALSYLFAIDGPRWLVKAAFIIAIAAAVRTRTAGFLFPLIPLGIAYLIARDDLGFLPSKLQFALFTISCLGMTVFYAGSRVLPTDKKRLIVLLASFFYVYLCFCCINFFTIRYIIAIIVPVTIGLVVYLVNALRLLHSKAIWIAPVIVAGAGFFMFRTDHGLGDVNLQSYNAMRVQDSTVAYLERQQWFGRKIGTGSFQDAEHLRKPYTGFLHTPQAFRDVKWDMDSTTEVVLFNNIEPDERINTIKADTRYRLTYRVEKGEAWAEIYSR